MSSAVPPTLGQLALNVRPTLRRHLSTVVGLCVGIAGWLYITDKPGGPAFLVMAFGSLVPLFFWVTQKNPGLPLAGMLGVQTLIIYGTPLVVTNPDVFQFPINEVYRSVFEVALFGVAIGFGWLAVAKKSSRHGDGTYWRFSFLGTGTNDRMARLAPVLLGGGALFLTLNQLRVLPEMPAGMFSIIRTLADAASIGGGVLGGYFLGAGMLKGYNKVLFISFLIIHCFLTSANYTLFPAVSLLVSLFVGLFIGRGRVPIVLTAVVLAIFGFLNLSKFEMRLRYWEPGTAYAAQNMSDLPGRYQEWFQLSYTSLTNPESALGERQREDQRLSNRINNLVNLLIAQDRIEHAGVEPLWGETYTIIPMLLIPRIFWEEKPRTHEGMVLLNVHFGRQTREDSLVTYISWGLLPEAYGNFGPFWGAIICGFALGAAMAWLEGWSRIYPLTSLQSLIFLLLVVQFGTSLESVASVWITSIFQMLVAVIGGNAFLVEKVRLPTPEP